MKYLTSEAAMLAKCFFLLSVGLLPVTGLLIAPRNASASAADPIVGFEAFPQGGSRTGIVAVSRSGAVKRVLIESSGQVSYIDEGNALSLVGSGGSVFDCEYGPNGYMSILTESGDLVSAVLHNNWDLALDWRFRGNVFVLAGVPSEPISGTAGDGGRMNTSL